VEDTGVTWFVRCDSCGREQVCPHGDPRNVEEWCGSPGSADDFAVCPDCQTDEERARILVGNLVFDNPDLFWALFHDGEDPPA
jgi:hypothetical protein